MCKGFSNVAIYALGVLTLASSFVIQLQAIPTVAVPEIDAGSIVSGIGLVTSGALILRARYRSRR
jgi:hypothetical protein